MKATVYNPLNEDFTVTYDVSGEGKPDEFTIKAYEAKEFDEVVANHMKKHLATHILNIRGIKTNHEDEYNAVINEISV